MRDISIQDLFKILPMDDKFRTQLQQEYESYPDGKKTLIMHECWKAFHKMFDEMKNATLENVMAEVMAGKLPDNINVAQLVEERVWKDIDDMFTGIKQEKDELDKVRTHLQNLLASSAQ